MGRTITLEEAREILGDEAKHYTDEALQELMTHFEKTARLIVRNFSVLKNRSYDELELV